MAKEKELKKDSGKKDTAKKARRIRPVRFLKEVLAELKKVTWPSRKDLIGYTVAVIVFVLLMSAVVGVLDFVFNSGFRLMMS